MKRFACHKLFVTPQLSYPQSVVEVDEAGTLQNHFLLTEEVGATEWVGGVFFLSPRNDLFHLSAQASWEEFSSQALQPEGQPLFVWHLNPFDFVHGCCTPQSKLRLLL